MTITFVHLTYNYEYYMTACPSTAVLQYWVSCCKITEILLMGQKKKKKERCQVLKSSCKISLHEEYPDISPWSASKEYS